MSEETPVDITDAGLESSSIPDAAVESDNTDSSLEPADTYAIKVDGEEQQVSLSELQDGYQRQADYTRKTQDLASERQRLQQAEAIVSALEADPSGTLTALHQAFGVEDNMSTQSSNDLDWEPDDPQSDRINRLEQQLESQAKIQRQQSLDKEIAGLKDQHGSFDEQELFQHALKNQIPNLEAAYAHMRFNEVAEKARKLEEERTVVDAKRDATVVENGGSKQTGAVVSAAASGKTPSTIREAFLQAKEALGA